MTPGFRIHEVHGDQAGYEDADKDNIVLPCNAVERDRVDKDVKQQRGVGREQDNGKPSGSEGEWPDLGDIRDE